MIQVHFRLANRVEFLISVKILDFDYDYESEFQFDCLVSSFKVYLTIYP